MGFYDHRAFRSPEAHAEWIMTGWFMAAGLVAILLSPASLSIDVYPRTMLPGGTVRLRCSVPRAADNRQLDYGIEGYSLSTVPLDGESAPITRQVYIEHVPCGVGDAFCVVTRADGSTRRAAQALNLACGE